MNIRPSSSNLHALSNDNDLGSFQCDIVKLLKAPKVSFRQPFNIPKFSLSSSSIVEQEYDEEKDKKYKDIDELSVNVETSAESVVKISKEYNNIPQLKLEDDDSAYFSSDDEENAEGINSTLTYKQDKLADINKVSSGKFPKILDKLLEKHYL